MDSLYKALSLATNSHKGQKDKAGVDYINHPVYLALQMNGEQEKIVALLHDVVEDTDITLDDLREQGFDDCVINAIEYLTHDKNEDYFEYIKRIKINNSLAAKVKLADLRHNSDLSRISNPTEKDYQRIEKYKKAIEMLEKGW